MKERLGAALLESPGYSQSRLDSETWKKGKFLVHARQAFKQSSEQNFSVLSNNFEDTDCPS